MRDGGIHLRKTKTASGATAIQAVRYVKRKVIVLHHFGSAHTPHEREVLLRDAESWLAEQSRQPSLLSAGDPGVSSSVVNLDQLTFGAVHHLFARDILCRALDMLGFLPLLDDVTADLVVMRLLEPSSKRRAIDRLRQLCGIVHGEQTVYRTLRSLAAKKEDTERLLVAHATQGGATTLSLVLYDVTTLYFESFREDDAETGLRKTGFSKDNKPQQPQIVIGLLVTPHGFPLGHEVFKGNTFEGHTMLPVLEAFQKRHGIECCTVVADAGMLSLENIATLRRQKFSYIVGARTANLPSKRIAEISASLRHTDKATMRLQTQHGDLICSFSDERYRKDKRDMEKQIARAKKLIASAEPDRRAKFVQKEGGTFILHDALIAKTQLLLGIKGYVTNIPPNVMDDQTVIDHYRNLWHVEQAFRMAKSDLQVRPIFHRREEAIRAHVLLCFIALAVQKHLEQVSGLSLRCLRDVIMQVTDITLTDEITGRTFRKRSIVPDEAKRIAELLGLSY